MLKILQSAHPRALLGMLLLAAAGPLGRPGVAGGAGRGEGAGVVALAWRGTDSGHSGVTNKSHIHLPYSVALYVQHQNVT